MKNSVPLSVRRGSLGKVYNLKYSIFFDARMACFYLMLIKHSRRVTVPVHAHTHTRVRTYSFLKVFCMLLGTECCWRPGYTHLSEIAAFSLISCRLFVCLEIHHQKHAITTFDMRITLLFLINSHFLTKTLPKVSFSDLFSITGLDGLQVSLSPENLGQFQSLDFFLSF